jgi:CRP/FNR family transcriptional regulator, anaerobic regulatory protein
MFDQLKEYYLRLIPQMSDEAWTYIAQRTKLMHFSKGENIVNEGTVCNYVYYINKGFTRFYVKAAGKEISTGFKGVGAYVSAYESFLTRRPAYECLGALEDVELWALSYDDMQHLYKAHPVFEIFARKIAEALFIMVNQRTNALLVLTPEQRYANMIENNSLLPQLVPQYMLASYIGVTPEHLSRLRKKLSVKK